MNADFPVNRGTIKSRKAVPVTAARGCDGGRLAQHFLISEALLHSFLSPFFIALPLRRLPILSPFSGVVNQRMLFAFPSLPLPTLLPLPLPLHPLNQIAP